MKNSAIVIAFIISWMPAVLSAKMSKKQQQVLKEKALNKTPKPMFLLKKATEDLGVEEPKQEFTTRQMATVTSDDRLKVDFSK